MADTQPQHAEYVAVTEQALVRAETEVEGLRREMIMGQHAESAADESDLYGKYVVFKQGDDGLEGPLGGCFVLRPDHDPAARKALSAYADADGVHGSPLARSLRQWLWDLIGASPPEKSRCNCSYVHDDRSEADHA